MQPTRTQQIKDAFRRLNDADPAERARILASEAAAADPEIWSLAESLVVRAERVPEAFLEPSADVVHAADRARERSGQFVECTGIVPGTDAETGVPGQTIGHYTLIRPLGEGGFGVVWEAEQHEPIHRLVALKLIKRGMDTKQIIRRFAVERQSLAVMDHPSITKVFDAGSTEDGRPYFAMELVIGVPIVDDCRDRDLPTDARLRLFEQVCQAIHHAHRRGIVHRDIKPSNVLVTDVDGKPTPRIIDFGIAMAMDPALQPGTKLTQVRQLVGTPAYMSPEQLEPRRGAVDERSDIYSLGVLLYEMLTGSTPRAGAPDARAPDARAPDASAQDAGSADAEALRSVGSLAASLEDPLPTSRRVSRLTGLPVDLDWITLRCLEPEKDRRYDSAQALAEDVRRFLEERPVVAGPPDLGYRIRKFCRRHRVAVGSAASLLGLLLVVGTVGFFWVHSKNRELDASNAELRVRNEQYLNEKSNAERALQDVERLSDSHLLASLLERAEADLWPMTPDRIDAMRLWIQEAEVLAARFETHRAELEAVRARALPEGRTGVATLRRAHERRSEPTRFVDSWIDTVEESLEKERAARAADRSARTWAFASTKDAWQHWLLDDLVRDLEAFRDEETGTLASVRRRLAFARTLHDRSIEQHAEAWRETVQAIVRGPTYPALRRTGFGPQIGLVPLGPDPDSGLLEFLDLATHDGPIPTRDADGRLERTDDTGVVLVLIPSGTFFLGAQSEDENARNFDALATVVEGPVHEVHVDAFFLGKFELTQAQWMRLEDGANPSSFYAGGYASGERVTRRHPVEQVQWGQGRRVLRRAGLVYPTEAQWEYATRAGTTEPFFFGYDSPVLAEVANLADISAKGVTTHISNLDDGHRYTAPVGSLDPNPFGLHDVYGNVAEWCSDLFLPTYASEKPLAEPLEESSLRDSRRRVARGGAFNQRPDNTRSARRHAVRGDSILSSVGVRPARRIER